MNEEHWRAPGPYEHQQFFGLCNVEGLPEYTLETKQPYL